MAIIFDKDGCLFDFDATWGRWAQGFLRSVSASESVPAEVLARAIGFDLAGGKFHRSSPAIAGTTEDVVRALLPCLPGQSPENLARSINRSACELELVPVTPLRPLLAGLRADGLALGLATNDSEVPARAHLAAAGVLDLFDRVYGADSGVGEKPSPGQLLAFCAEMKIDATASVMVGDSVHDISAARAAGMTAVAVLTGPATESDLAPLADAVLPDIGHLPAWLAQQHG